MQLKLSELQKENDSLKTLIDTLNTKAIFDEAMLTSIPMLWKDNGDDDVIEAWIGYSATNKDEKILFSTDSLFKDCDTLSYDQEFTVKVNKNIRRVYYKSLSSPKFGKEIGVVVSDPMKNYR